jgi:hypothetical protein
MLHLMIGRAPRWRGLKCAPIAGANTTNPTTGGSTRSQSLVLRVGLDHCGSPLDADDPIRFVAAALLRGQIVAIKERIGVLYVDPHPAGGCAVIRTPVKVFYSIDCSFFFSNT